MVDEDIGCCATLQKWLIFIVNIILFIFGVVQVGIACYIIAAGSENLGFAAELFDGNDSAVYAMLAFGIIIVIISFLACVGAKSENKCLLWLYAIVLFFMIMGQAMVLAVTAISLEYGDSIFESLWKELDIETIENIEQTYKCCSFNGKNVTNTWPADASQYATCKSENDFDPMETCWGKFESSIDANYCMVKTITAIVLAVQTVIYFSTHFVIQSIAEAEGAEAEKDDVQFTNGAPRV